MWIHRWAWRPWPATKQPVVNGRHTEPPPQDGPRRFTEQHARLLSQLTSEKAPTDWSGTALTACLEHLRTSDVTEAWQIAVQDAWKEGPDAFCVVYQSPYADGQVAVRRTVDDASRGRGRGDQKSRPGDMTVAYDMGSADLPDPVMFGWNVADFDIGEPGIGPVRRDEASGTSWWGTLGDALPTKPITS